MLCTKQSALLSYAYATISIALCSCGERDNDNDKKRTRRRRDRAAARQVYPDAVCALHYTHDYELLFATRLSAQCTDARVNIVTKELFATVYQPCRASPNAPAGGD